MSVTKKIRPGQSGIALLTTILLMLLMSSLLVGFILLINSGHGCRNTWDLDDRQHVQSMINGLFQSVYGVNTPYLSA